MGPSMICILFIALTNGMRAEVFGIYTVFGSGEQRTIVHGGQLDMQTGNVHSIAKIFTFFGSSGFLDGVSAFDQKRGIFFYTSDFMDSYIYGVDTTSGKLQPPIFLEDSGIVSLHFDFVRDRLLVVDFVNLSNHSRVTRMVAIPMAENASYTAFSFPTSFQPGNDAFDSKMGLYYSLDFTTGALSIWKVDSSSLILTKTIQTTNCSYITKFFISAVHPVFTSSLWGVQESPQSNNQILYQISNLNFANGVCESQSIPATGILTCYAFDELSGTLFYFDTGSQSPCVRQFNVRTSETKKTIIPSSQWTFSDIAVRFIR